MIRDEKDRDNIDGAYARILQQTLTSPEAVLRLTRLQALEGKQKFVQFHESLLNQKHAQFLGTSMSVVKIWSEGDRRLISKLQQSQTVDFYTLLSLKMALCTASKEYIQSFCDNHGLSVLMRAMLRLINHVDITIMDAAVLYECLLCVKCVMNHSSGLLKALENTQGILDVVAMCCLFQHRHLALLVSRFVRKPTVNTSPTILHLSLSTFEGVRNSNCDGLFCSDNGKGPPSTLGPAQTERYQFIAAE